MAKKKLINDKLKMKIVDVIIYACFGFILFWAILKAAGVFSTPLWLELAPVITGSLGALFLIYKFGFSFGLMSSDITYMKKDISELKKDTSRLKSEVIEIKTGLKGFRKDYDYHVVKHPA